MRINRSLVYKSFPVDRINTQVTYPFYVPDNFANKTRVHCHSWPAGQYIIKVKTVFTDFHFYPTTYLMFIQ